MEEMIKKYMSKYDCSREEAIELIKDDEETDSMSVGAINRELTAEQREAINSTVRTSSEKRKAPKERKKDEEKRSIINALYEIAKTLDGNAVVSNPEKEINITINGNHYTIGLTKHRPPKNK